MGELADFLKSKKNLINLLVLGIIILALPLGMQLVRTQQILRSRATIPPVVITGPNVIDITGGRKALKPNEQGDFIVGLELTSPLGPPATATQSATITAQGGFVNTVYGAEGDFCGWNGCEGGVAVERGGSGCIRDANNVCQEQNCEIISFNNCSGNGCHGAGICNEPPAPPGPNVPPSGGQCTGSFTDKCGSNNDFQRACQELKVAGWGGNCSSASCSDIKTVYNNTVNCGSPSTPPPTSPPAVNLGIGISAGQGSVTSNTGGINCPGTCSATYNSGTVVTLTAVPSAGYSFNSWGAACSGGAASTTVTMDSTKSCTAAFSLVPSPQQCSATVQRTCTEGTKSGTQFCLTDATDIAACRGPGGNSCFKTSKTWTPSTGGTSPEEGCAIAICPVTGVSSTQVKFRNADNTGSWTNPKTINISQCARVGGFHNNLTPDTLPTDITSIAVSGPEGFSSIVQNGANFCPPQDVQTGSYTFTALTDGVDSSQCRGSGMLHVSAVGAPVCSSFTISDLSQRSGTNEFGGPIYDAPSGGGNRGINVSFTPNTATATIGATPPLTINQSGANRTVVMPANTTNSEIPYRLNATIVSGALSNTCTPLDIKVATPTPDTSCPSDIDSTEARFRVQDSDSWSTDLDMKVGTTLNVRGFINDRTDRADTRVALKVIGPQGQTSTTIDLSGNPAVFTPSEIGRYTVTAYVPGATGSRAGNCINTGRPARIDVEAIPLTTTHYRIAETPAGFVGNEGFIVYDRDTVVTNHTFSDKTLGARFIFVEFKRSDGQIVRRSAPIELVVKPQLTSCNLSVSDTLAEFTIKGQNFGTRQGSLKSEDTNLVIRRWRNDEIVARLQGAPSGQAFPISLKDANGLETEGSCSSISQLAFSAKLFCRESLQFDTDEVRLTVAEGIEGGKVSRNTVRIDKKGVVQELNIRLAERQGYKIGVKAPKSLRRVKEILAGAGTTIISNFSLPVGDIFPLDEGDGRINSADKAQLNREWRLAGGGTARSGDFNRDGLVNSFDWACMRYDFGASDDDEPIPGPLTTITPPLPATPSATPSSQPVSAPIGP